MLVRLSARHLTNIDFLLSIGCFMCVWTATREAYTLYVFSQTLGSPFWTLAMLLAFAVFSVFYLGLNNNSTETGVPNTAIFGCAIIGMLGIATLHLEPVIPLPTTVSLFLGVFMVCGAFAALIRFWGERNCCLDIVEIVGRAAASLLLTSVYCLLSSAFPDAVRATLCAAFFLAAGACLALKAQRDVSASSSVISARPLAEPSHFLPAKWSKLLLMGVAITLFACGLIWSASPTEGTLGWSTGSFLASGILVISTLFFIKRFPLNILPIVSLTVIQICILAILSNRFQEWIFTSLLWFGHALLWIWVLSVSCWQGSLEPNAPGRMVAQGMLLLIVSNLAGMVAGKALSLPTESILILSAVLLVFAAEFIFSSARLFDRPLDQQKEIPALGLTRNRLQQIANKHEFTPREYDVFLLLRKGYSVKRISQELIVSDNTTKTHIRALYLKLGVHTRQELIDIAESSE
jgi:DNA-binding CsgD family transcriptional regulator